MDHGLAHAILVRRHVLGPVGCPMSCGMSSVLSNIALSCVLWACPMSCGPALCPMALSYVLSARPMSNGSVLRPNGPIPCPMSHVPWPMAHVLWPNGPVPEFPFPRASCLMARVRLWLVALWDPWRILTRGGSIDLRALAYSFVRGQKWSSEAGSSGFRGC